MFGLVRKRKHAKEIVALILELQRVVRENPYEAEAWLKQRGYR